MGAMKRINVESIEVIVGQLPKHYFNNEEENAFLLEEKIVNDLSSKYGTKMIEISYSYNGDTIFRGYDSEGDKVLDLVYLIDKFLPVA